VPTLKNSSISPRKNISGTYLIFLLFARGRATSKHGGGGRYGAVLEFKGEYFKKMMMKEKNPAIFMTFKVKKYIYIMNE
jgi:hypothetical protein